MRSIRVLVVVVVAGLALVLAPRAAAGCHAFTIEASPATVGEGGTVTVTVTRDAAFNPSSVKVTSIDETATAGPDYPEVDRTISFTTEVEQSFEVAITQDGDDEGDETFRLHLSDAGGCAVNPNFQFGPDARVTIADDDEPATTTTAPPAPTTAAPTTTAGDATTTTAGDDTTTTVEPGDAPDVPGTDTTDATGDDTTTTSEEELAIDEIAADDDGDDVSGLVVAIAVVAALAAGVGGYLIYRRRSPAA